MLQGATRLVEAIHASNVVCSIIATGGGASAIAELMSVPGCSKTLLEASIPYHADVSSRAMDMFPLRYSSPEVGRLLAQTAFYRARTSASPLSTVVGIGATAAIATDRSRKGNDCVFLTCWGPRIARSYAVPNIERAVGRAEQERVIGYLILRALAEAASIAPELVASLPNDEHVDVTEAATDGDVIQHLLSGGVSSVVYNAHGVPRTSLEPYSAEHIDPAKATYLLYPGSFNPLHWGHSELARVASIVAEQRAPARNRPVILTYEISASIVGKADLHTEDVLQRVKQFTDSGRRIAMTNAKLFVDKARMFPHHGFVVGVDTAVRVMDPQFYGNSKEQMLSAMAEIKRHGCYFIVGGRVKEDVWVDLDNADVPVEIKDMFVPIKAEMFRVDISSTDLRKRRSSTPDASATE